MIRQLTEASQLDCGCLKTNRYGRWIYTYLRAYGVGYDFCRFFRIEGAGTGYALLFNATLTIYMDPTKEDLTELAREIQMFIAMHQPFRVETTANLMQYLMQTEGYHPLHRTVFELTSTGLPEDFDEYEIDFAPRLDDAYDILREGFPHLIAHDLWLTDVSHRLRRGVSKVFTYKNSTTATILYDVDNEVLIAQVATRAAARGSGYARQFLRWLAGFLEQFGKNAVLMALDIRVSFYTEIGFRPLETEYVLERTEHDPEAMQKGKLN